MPSIQHIPLFLWLLSAKRVKGNSLKGQLSPIADRPDCHTFTHLPFQILSGSRPIKHNTLPSVPQGKNSATISSGQDKNRKDFAQTIQA